MTIDKNKMKVKIGWIKYYEPEYPNDIIEDQFPIIKYGDIEVAVDLLKEHNGAMDKADWSSFAYIYTNELELDGYIVIDYGIYE